MEIIRTTAEAAAFARSLPRPLALVPTMGALHAGHLALVRAAKRANASVAASIFVNPLQFGPGEDFARYPRAFDSDIRQLREAGVDLVFAPSVDQMYPADFDSAVDPGTIGTRFEGELRPGHFRGVATVCVKLFGVTGAERAYFGIKDAQQLAVLRQVVRDLALPIALEAVPTVRAADGLALSSRNTYLTPAERTAAPGLYAALCAMAAAAAGGERDRERIIAAGRERLVAPLREAYLDIVDPVTFAPLDRLVPRAGPGDAPAALAIGSAWAGPTRLIDNVGVPVPATALAAAHASPAG
jgi:pantoate--beta-alanine ligase